MKVEDQGLRAVREVRERISAEFGNDPTRLVDHYLSEQERYRDRLLPRIADRQADAADEASRHR